MRILVHGAGGTQGTALVRRLRAEGEAVRAYSRDAGRAAALADLGVELVAARLDDPGSLVGASEGVDAVLVQVPAAVAPAGQVAGARAALAAAAAAGVPTVVVATSSIVPAAPTGRAAPDAKHELVRLAAELTPAATVLTTTLYLENLPMLLSGEVLPYPIPADVPVGWVTVDDLAAVAAAALRRPDLAGRRLAVAGPEALTGPQLAERLARVLGRPLAYQPVPPAAFGAQLAPFLGEEVAAALAEMYAWEGGPGAPQLAPDPAPAAAAAGVTLTALERWAEAALR